MPTETWTAAAGPSGRPRRHSGIVNIVLALLAAAVLIWAFTLVRGTSSSSSGSTSAANVRTVVAATGAVTATVTADGSLDAASTSAASFTTAGTVTAVDVKVGQTVTKGQTLAQVDPSASNRALALAEANLDAANDALARARKAASDTTTAANDVTQAQLAVTDAKADVAGCKLIAPMAGTVVAVNGTIGGTSAVSGSSGPSSSTSSTGFIELADLTKLQVTAEFAEADATRLKTGQPVVITWSALTGAQASGTVLAVDPEATTTNSVVTYGVTTSVETLPEGARPGQTVSVSVTTGTVRSAVTVNSAAVKVSGDRYTVTVLATDGTRSTRQIKVGLKGDDAYQVTSGLVAGEKVVLPQTTTATKSTDQGGPGGFPGGGGAGPGGGR